MYTISFVAAISHGMELVSYIHIPHSYIYIAIANYNLLNVHSYS